MRLSVVPLQCDPIFLRRSGVGCERAEEKGCEDRAFIDVSGSRKAPWTKSKSQIKELKKGSVSLVTRHETHIFTSVTGTLSTSVAVHIFAASKSLGCHEKTLSTCTVQEAFGAIHLAERNCVEAHGDVELGINRAYSHLRILRLISYEQ